MEIGGSISGALFSDPNRKYRYALWRIWDRSRDKLLFIGLNPSTANDIYDDPTIRRLIGFAKAWGYGGLFAGNLFSLVTSDPEELWMAACTEQPLGPNDTAIKQMRELCSMVMVGWGADGQYAEKRPDAVLSLLGEPVYCLRITKSGEPGHPLYLPLSAQLKPYTRKAK